MAQRRRARSSVAVEQPSSAARSARLRPCSSRSWRSHRGSSRRGSRRRGGATRPRRWACWRTADTRAPDLAGDRLDVTAEVDELPAEPLVVVELRVADPATRRGDSEAAQCVADGAGCDAQLGGDLSERPPGVYLFGEPLRRSQPWVGGGCAGCAAWDACRLQRVGDERGVGAERVGDLRDGAALVHVLVSEPCLVGELGGDLLAASGPGQRDDRPGGRGGGWCVRGVRAGRRSRSTVRPASSSAPMSAFSASDRRAPTKRSHLPRRPPVGRDRAAVVVAAAVRWSGVRRSLSREGELFTNDGRQLVEHTAGIEGKCIAEGRGHVQTTLQAVRRCGPNQSANRTLP